MKQLHYMEKFVPLDPRKISKKAGSEELAPLMFLTDKRDRIIKESTCADGIKQLSYIRKEGVVSPMVSLEDIMIK